MLARFARALVLIIVVFASGLCAAQTEAPVATTPPSTIAVPADSDAYATMVRKAEAGDLAIDYRAMRLAYIQSAAFLRAQERTEELNRLKKELIAARNASDANGIQQAARRIMGIVYIDLGAQKLLRQSCAVLKDAACANRYHDVEFGLLKSITASGNGLTCATGWEVVTIAEEYFMLEMQGLKLKSQQGPGDYGTCDKMTVVDEKGETRAVFFNVKAIFAGYERVFKH